MSGGGRRTLEVMSVSKTFFFFLDTYYFICSIFFFVIPDTYLSICVFFLLLKKTYIFYSPDQNINDKEQVL